MQIESDVKKQFTEEQYDDGTGEVRVYPTLTIKISPIEPKDWGYLNSIRDLLHYNHFLCLFERAGIQAVKINPAW